jgi:DNA polymerase
LDTETYSATPIKRGAYRYAEDAEVMLVPFAVNDGPVTVWDTQDEPHWRAKLQDEIDSADRVVIHNSMFDRVVLAAQGVHIPVEKIDDTMVVALMHSLPAGLGQLGEVLGVPADKAKDKEGKKLIQLFCSPCPKNWKIERATRETHPNEWDAFKRYAALDVVAMRDIHGRLPRWNDTPAERVLWQLDQRINDDGVRGDAELARAAVRAFERTVRSMAATISALTGGVVTSATQRQKVLDYLDDHCHLALPDLTGATVSEYMARSDISDTAREILDIRRQAAATSPAKYGTFLSTLTKDGRVKGTVQFCGASRTGRDAGRLVQLQNLPRSSMPYERIELGIAAMKADCEDLLFDDVSELCANAVRGLFVASEGNKLVVADLSNIEGRVIAWLAGEEWKLGAFRDFDAGRGHDLYKITAGRILGKSPEDVTKDERSNPGKISELACGFGGSVGAFRKMGGATVDAMNDEAVVEIVQAWRSAHSAIKRWWYALQDAVKWAIRRKGTTHEVGLLRISCNDAGWLRIKLPSGRYLSYPNARLDDEGAIWFDGVDQYTKQWGPQETYYGRIAENITQAVARDVFMHGMRLACAAGYRVVMRVHDELVCDVPDAPEYTAEGLAALMATNPSWSVGLPLAAEGFETKRYRK